MRVFITRIALYFTLLGILVGLYILFIYFRPELVDNFYRRFTTHRAPSLIIGTSRSAQGIMPEIINKRIFNGEKEMFNHSFALGPSSFGPNYFREIRSKLDRNSTGGVFIISVDPWSLATGTDNIKDDSLKFYEFENKLFVGNLNSSSTNPNLDYLYNHWTNRFSLFGNGFKHLINYGGILELHEDGWLEVNITMDSVTLKSRISRSTEEYSQKKMMLSGTRFQYLGKIINYLGSHGKVYVVRLPVSPEMAQLEKNRFPDFDERIQQVSKEEQVPYFNFISQSGKYKTIDTHHLYKTESERITNRICDSIGNDHVFPRKTNGTALK